MNEREFFPLLFDDYANNFFPSTAVWQKGILEINGNDEEKFSFLFSFSGKVNTCFTFNIDKNENLFFFLLFF